MKKKKDGTDTLRFRAGTAVCLGIADWRGKNMMRRPDGSLTPRPGIRDEMGLFAALCRRVEKFGRSERRRKS